MPAILEKRVTDSSAPSPKKARTAVQKQVQEVVATLSSEDFQVAGSSANRQMLLALAPCVLQTPQNGRHPFQEEIGGMLKEVFQTEVARLKANAQDIQASIDNSGAGIAACKAAVDVAASNVQKKDAELKEKMAVLATDVGVARTAKEALDATVSDLTEQQEFKELYAEEKKDLAAKVESFAFLKEGSWETDAPKDQIKVLVSLFRKLKADASLVAALPMALGRKPDERSQFDSLTVTELEKKLTGKVEELENKLKEIEASLSEKEALKTTNESAFTVAENKKRTGAEALLQTRAEQKELDSTLAEKKQKVTEGEIEHKALEAEHSQKTSELNFHEGVQGKLIELLERTTEEAKAAEE